jgi:hypothetical protein
MNVAVVSLCIGGAGLALGIWNAVHAFRKDRVRLRVKPKLYWVTQRGVITGEGVIPSGFDLSAARICIEVANVSNFPVTVDMVGFLLKNTNNRIVISDGHTTEDERLPMRIESRDSVTIIWKDPPGPLPLDHIKCAFATTHCDTTGRGITRAFKDYVKHQRAKALGLAMG